MNRFWIKLTNYEYWPMWAFYLPLLPYVLYRGLINRNFFHFTNVNHNLDEFRGLFFDSKSVIDDKIPQAYRPKSLTIHPKEFSLEKIAFWEFPVIIKPDQGERGRGVRKVNNLNEAVDIINKYDELILIQEYVDYEMEFGVFVAINPINLKYEILSLARKHYFEIQGDGHSNIGEIILMTPRGKVFYKELAEISSLNFNVVPPKKEIVQIHTQGNHCKGTRFEDASYLINSANQRMFGQFLKGLDGFEYGRFDIKCKTEEDLETFQNLKVIEFNGIAAEPISIYDSNVGYFKSLITFIRHWKRLEEIAKFNLSRGYKPISSVKLLRKITQHLVKN